MGVGTIHEAPPVILTLAGYDPSSGAGVSADVKTAAAHGCYSIGCITAMTVQSTQGVRSVHPLPAEMLRQTLRELQKDFTIAAVRIGMLGSAEIAMEIVEFLRYHPTSIVVFDPVLRASSGAALMEDCDPKWLNQLLPLATVVTPNVDEAEAMTGIPVRCETDQRRAAAKLLTLGAQAAVVTGGHLDPACDLLLWRDPDGSLHEKIFSNKILQSNSTHGTGCAFACSMACRMALGDSVAQAAVMAKLYVRHAIEEAYPLGQGKGPINHMWGMRR